MGSGMLQFVLRSHALEGDEAPAVIVAITDARSLLDVPAEAWSTLLGVTAAEASLVAALAQGKTLERHAAQRGISIGTARNQLKQALAKTGTTRQADLVRLALTSAAAHMLSTISETQR
jgi:DNA-binding CsgD family transcriptional regulator